MTGPRLPGMPEAGGEPVFAEPWMAQAFALTLQLHARGLFGWPEWADALGRQIATAPADSADADPGAAYYRHWLGALESLVVAKGAAGAHELGRLRAAWDHAARRTPHGQPIELSEADFDGG